MRGVVGLSSKMSFCIGLYTLSLALTNPTILAIPMTATQELVTLMPANEPNNYNDPAAASHQQTLSQQQALSQSPVPRVIRQMFLGNPRPSTLRMMDGVERNAKQDNIEYRRYNASHHIPENFPHSWDVMCQLRAHALQREGMFVDPTSVPVGYGFLDGVKTKYLSSMVDVARLELLHGSGGVWLDANIEALKPFSGLFELRLRDGVTFPNMVTCHEADGPWAGWNDQRSVPTGTDLYLSNGFVMTVPKHPLIARLLSPDALGRVSSQIQLIPEQAHLVTGPAHFASEIKAVDDFMVLPAKSFYPVAPFWPRFDTTNPCCRCGGPGCEGREVCEMDKACGECGTGGVALLEESFAMDHFECGGSWK